MCLTIPGKIKKIKDGTALVENGARTALVDLGLVFDAKVGDWILYATERAVKIISEKDAKEIISLLEEHYRSVDVSQLPKRFTEIIFKIKSQQDTRNKYQKGIRGDSEGIQKGEKGETGDRGSIRGTKGGQKGSKGISKRDIEYLLKLEDPDCLETLYAEANTLRKERIEDFVCIHGIIEFSNYCKNNCLYCGIRHDNLKLKRYRMTKKEIVAAAKEAVENEGYKLIVLQSGEDDYYSDGEMIKMIKKIKKMMRVFIFISVGERSKEFYRKAKEAGASGSLIRFETSNPELYAKLRPGHILDNRIQSIRYQQELGYYVASGSMVGLPGQTIGDIADDLLMIQKLGIPMISSGPWLPASGTPLARYKIQDTITKSPPLAGSRQNAGQISNFKYQISNKNQNDQMTKHGVIPAHSTSSGQAPAGIQAIDIDSGSQITGRNDDKARIELFLKYIAVARLMLPEIKIPVTTALETLDPENGRHRGLLAGANALMFNLTPEKFAGNYNIYDNKYREREKVWQKYGLFRGEESWEMLEEKLNVLL